ncbi:hypothetical protein ASG11_12980 [Sphingomonas sp. Leaf357]|nr:hypothetical protein ASG11_12980 [Sphingomonas sp. Leaf357]
MPRYFFNIHNDTLTQDYEGREFASLDAAREYAISETRILAAESVRELGHLILDHRIDILTTGHERVATIRFGDVIKIKPHEIGRKS